MAEKQTMAGDTQPVGPRPPLGHCPRCAVPIPRALELIEYETADGVSRFAECPTCGDVVRPRQGR